VHQKLKFSRVIHHLQKATHKILVMPCEHIKSGTV